MNSETFQLINGLSYKNYTFDKIMIFFSKDVPYIFMATLVIIFILGIIKNKSDYRKAAVNAFLITVINLSINFIIGNIYYVDRPFVHNKVNLLFPHVKDSSFPSDHATGTMSIALGLGRFNPVVRVLLIVLSVIVGFSRIYVGHHYPLDIVGAYIVVLITNYIYNHTLRNKIENLYETLEKKKWLKHV